MAQHALHQQPQLFVFRQQLRHHLPQHPLQDLRIVRQSFEIDLHIESLTHHIASLPMTPA